jgi:uncharacterized membrane protein
MTRRPVPQTTRTKEVDPMGGGEIGEIAMVVLFVVLGILAFVAALLILPAMVVRQGRRLRRLERRLAEIEAAQLGAKTAAAAGGLETPLVPILIEEPAGAEPPTAEPPGSEVSCEPAAAPTEGVEAWIGRRVMGWAAVLLLLLATAFFLKQAFENRWIGELGRVALGILAGVGLCAAGYRYHARGWRVFSQMFSAGGIVLLYLATFGAFGYYHLLPQQQAGIFLVVLVAETALLAVLYEAPAIALMAVVGGLLTPILLHTDRDQYRALFLYLALVDAGVVFLAALRTWPACGTVALVGTQAVFWAWYEEHYHPEKLAAALGFQAAVFGLFLLYGLVSHVFRRRGTRLPGTRWRVAGIEDLVRWALAAALGFAAAYTLLDPDYHVWMSSLALGMALVYTAVGWLVLVRRPDDPRQLLLAVAVAMGLVAAAITLQLEASWIALGWAVEGLALWWFGVRTREGALRGLAAALLVLAVGRLVVIDTPAAHPEPFIPLCNAYALPALGVAACVLAAAAAGARFCRKQQYKLPQSSRDRTGTIASWDRLAVGAAALGGIALVWCILSVEAYDYFHAWVRQDHLLVAQYGPEAVRLRGEPLAAAVAEEVPRLQRDAQTALSVVWAAYAAAVLAAGFTLRTAPVRWAALALFGLTLAKVLLVDMAGLPGFYRVTALLALALMMGIAAWAYQRWLAARKLQNAGETL